MPHVFAGSIPATWQSRKNNKEELDRHASLAMTKSWQNLHSLNSLRKFILRFIISPSSKVVTVCNPSIILPVVHEFPAFPISYLPPPSSFFLEEAMFAMPFIPDHAPLAPLPKAFKEFILPFAIGPMSCTPSSVERN